MVEHMLSTHGPWVHFSAPYKGPKMFMYIYYKYVYICIEKADQGHKSSFPVMDKKAVGERSLFVFFTFNTSMRSEIFLL